jgi:hypothetical protein
MLISNLMKVSNKRKNRRRYVFFGHSASIFRKRKNVYNQQAYLLFRTKMKIRMLEFDLWCTPIVIRRYFYFHLLFSQNNY